MNKIEKLKAGDLVEIRSKEEILRTLDKGGQLDGLPFMPEMFAFCGRQFRVQKSAHKTCDTVFPIRGRKMADAVHLETRCDGAAHGGCQAGCLIFWKNAWLKPVRKGVTLDGAKSVGIDEAESGCTEKDVLEAATGRGGEKQVEPKYSCQATQLPYATSDLHAWNLKQYVQDYSSGNVRLGQMLRGFIFMGYRGLINLGIGLGPVLRWLYDVLQGLWGGLPYPRRVGKVPAGQRTPCGELGLEPGEWVRVKSYQAILETCDAQNKNRGMTFDAEMVPYCGRTFRVLKRVSRIVNEQTGKMQLLPNPCIILDGVFCQSRYSECRLFCPRAIYPYWREIWLERVSAPGVVAKSIRSSETKPVLCEAEV